MACVLPQPGPGFGGKPSAGGWLPGPALGEQFPLPGNRVAPGVGARSQGSRVSQNSATAAVGTKLYLCSEARLLFGQRRSVLCQPQLSTVQSEKCYFTPSPAAFSSSSSWELLLAPFPLRAAGSPQLPQAGSCGRERTA